MLVSLEILRWPVERIGRPTGQVGLERRRLPLGLDGTLWISAETGASGCPPSPVSIFPTFPPRRHLRQCQRRLHQRPLSRLQRSRSRMTTPQPLNSPISKISSTWSIPLLRGNAYGAHSGVSGDSIRNSDQSYFSIAAYLPDLSTSSIKGETGAGAPRAAYPRR